MLALSSEGCLSGSHWPCGSTQPPNFSLKNCILNLWFCEWTCSLRARTCCSVLKTMNEGWKTVAKHIFLKSGTVLYSIHGNSTLIGNRTITRLSTVISQKCNTVYPTKKPEQHREETMEDILLSSLRKDCKERDGVTVLRKWWFGQTISGLQCVHPHMIGFSSG